MLYSFGHKYGDVVVMIDHESPDVYVVSLAHGKGEVGDPVDHFRPGFRVPIDHVQFHHQLVPRLSVVQIHCLKEPGEGGERGGKRCGQGG